MHVSRVQLGRGRHYAFVVFFRHFQDSFTALPLSLLPSCQVTVIQDTLKTGLKYSSVPRAQERVSERASERESAAERASEASSLEQCERMSGASERTIGCPDCKKF